MLYIALFDENVYENEDENEDENVDYLTNLETNAQCMTLLLTQRMLHFTTNHTLS